MTKPLRVYIIAGEASGDIIGAKLMQAMREEVGARGVEFFGIGGAKMEEQHLESLFPYHVLSLIGIVEVLPHAMKIKARIDLAVEDVMAKKPDVLITIDVPGFSLRVVEKLREKKFQTKYVQYVAPTVWAYRPERAKKCATLYDHLLAILPFEPPYFIKEGLPCTYVGHPILHGQKERGDAAAFRAKYTIPESTKIIPMLPGSRIGEIKRHMPIFSQTIDMLAPRLGDFLLVVPTSNFLMPLLAQHFRGCPYKTLFVVDEDDKRNALAGSTVVLSKSGTVALEVAAAGAPMIVAYRTNPLTAFVLRRILQIKNVNLLNILAGKTVIPEFLQEQCKPVYLASALAYLLSHPEAAAAQTKQTSELLAQLSPPENTSPSTLAARTILTLL